MTPKILVTGAQGQLGQSFQWLSTQGALPLSATLQLLGRQELDISKRDSIEQALLTYQPDVVINTAAYTAVDKAESEPDLAYAINATAVEHLAQACAQHGVRFVHVSTDYVFDGCAAQPYAEDAATNPCSVYGASKLAGEQAALAALPSSIILRTSWVFSQFCHNFLKTMLRLGTERDALSIVDDQFGGPTYAPHIAQVLLQLAQHPQAHGIYHFAGSPHVSWFEFAQAIFSTAHKQQLLPRIPTLTPIPTQAYPTPARRPAQSGLSMGRLKSLRLDYLNDWALGVEASCKALRAF